MEKTGGDNRVAQAVVACAQCCLKCIEKVCDYINVSAYSYQAVTGKNFCLCAWEAFLLQVRHLMKFSFANFLAKCFIFLGKISIVAGNCASLYGIMKYVTIDTEEVNSILGPMAVVAVFSYITATILLGMFETVVMGMLTCLSIDLDLNGGTPAKGPATFHDNINK